MGRERLGPMDENVRSSISQVVSVQSDTLARLGSQETISEVYRVASKINQADGRVAFSGIGKSGDIAQKIVDTFNSIGVTSHFVHPVEALHGDLGALSSGDVVVLISNSGSTDEMIELLKFITHFDPVTVSITSDPDSQLAQQSDYHINTKATDEGAVVDLIPMASATATMVIGDCIANALMTMRGFDKKQYGHFHPGGTIGKRLLLDVEDLLYTELPTAKPSDTIAEVVLQMSNGGKGIGVVCDDDNRVLGVLTDGDIRRLVETGDDFNTTLAKDVMTSDPITVSPDTPAIKALEIIEEYDITQLVVTNNGGEFEGVIHIHDIMSEGLTT